MDEKINKLLTKPVSKWTKADRLYAAKIVSEEFLLHKSRPIAIIQRARMGIPQYEEIFAIAYKQSDETGASKNFISKATKDAKREHGRETAKRILQLVEHTRQKLSSEKKIDLSKIKYKDVAMYFAEHSLRKGNKPLSRRHALAKDMEQFIKYMKQKAKSG